MFYCNKCAKENGYPETLTKSIGVCELCKHVTECNDMPSSELPLPKDFQLKSLGLNESPFPSRGIEFNPQTANKITESGKAILRKTMDNVGKNVKFENSYIVGIGKVDGEGMPLFLSTKRIKYGKYPIIDIPADGKPKWMGGAFELCFVYSKRNGNFILRGYSDEVEKYLKKNYTHYFFYNSLWSQGRSRGHWQFWKDGVYISAPSKHEKTWKYSVVRYKSSGRFNSLEELKSQKEIRLTFKRLPKQWIPEFDQL